MTKQFYEMLIKSFKGSKKRVWSHNEVIQRIQGVYIQHMEQETSIIRVADTKLDVDWMEERDAAERSST